MSDDDKVYVFVYDYLKDANTGRVKYFSESAIRKLAFKKFGESWDVEDSVSRAFSEFYESDFFMNKLRSGD